MASIIRLDELFYDMLKDIYYAEKKILKTLPKMVKAIGKDTKLSQAFQKHHEETEGQIERLEKVFDIIGQKARGKTCEAIDGITEEAEELIHEVDCKATLEAGLLADAQAVEHYEIARYGTLVEWAKLLGYADAVKLLQETLVEEKKTDELLNKLAIQEINRRALESYKESNNTKNNRQAA